MKNKSFFYLVILVGFILFSNVTFSQEKLDSKRALNVGLGFEKNQIIRDIGKKHNELMTEFFGIYLKQTKTTLSFDVDFIDQHMREFLKTKGYEVPFTKNEIINIVKNPQQATSVYLKNENIRKFIQTSLRRIENIKAISGLQNEIRLLRKELNKFNDEDNLFIAAVYIEILDASQKLYSNKQFISYLDEFYERSTGIKMKPFWKVVTMCAADAVGAGIGALAGANPATIVGGATTVSGFATKLLDDK